MNATDGDSFSRTLALKGSRSKEGPGSSQLFQAGRTHEGDGRQADVTDGKREMGKEGCSFSKQD